MEGLCQFLTESRSSGLQFDKESTGLEVSEIYLCQQSVEVRQRGLSNDEVDGWLRRQGDDDAIKLRLVWVSATYVRQLGIRRRTFDKIVKTFGIKEAAEYACTAEWGVTVLPSKDAHAEQILSYTIFSDILDFALTWKHNITSGATYALCWANPYLARTLRSLLVHQKELAQHSMLLPLIAAIALEHGVQQELKDLNMKIGTIENRTRHHGFSVQTQGVAKGKFPLLSAEMSGYATELAGRWQDTKIVREILNLVDANLKRPNAGNEPLREEQDVQVKECAELLNHRLVVLETEISYHSHRVEIQLTALFNIINQQGTRVSIAVAEDSRKLASASKEDSSSMKTLAAVTVTFLPGTFVASFFAMPLFQLETTPMVSGRFWMYWAVTLPLTLLTLSIWRFWTTLQTRNISKQEDKAMEDLWDNIDGDEITGRRVAKDGAVESVSGPALSSPLGRIHETGFGRMP